ncbi:uncharacterized protein LOC141851488 [Brevipalpus obovatus]|uniref:uncharacterized protein LOC141851488 n=1 Tax=Brevipalpus obovatus TaxID=246614 RepID=UPI003D9EBF80
MKSTLLFSLFVILVACSCFQIITCDPHHPNEFGRKSLYHDKTVINCAHHGRSLLQHSCVLAPTAVEGPYYIPGDLERSDISESKPGIPLDITIGLVNAGNCTPVGNAVVHVWQCDADGEYSGFDSSIPLPRHPLVRLPPVNDKRYLRGFQITDHEGMVQFTSIVPGWYAGRTMHIHLEVNLGNTVVHIGQLYFEEQFSKMIEQVEPYVRNINERMTNKQDIHYLKEGGEQTTLKLSGDIENGFKLKVILGIRV